MHMNFKTPFRNLYKYRLNSGVIIISLAVGFACVYLIAIFLLRESNPDNFQLNAESIFALQAESPFDKDGKMHTVREGAAEYMKENFADIDEFCRYKNAGSPRVRAGNNDFNEEIRVMAASPNFFDFFSYNLTATSTNELLSATDQVVISKELSRKYFGKENPIGKKVTLVNNAGSEHLYVSGIFEKPEKTTLLNFDMVKKIDSGDSYAFLLLSNNAKVGQLEEHFEQKKNIIPIIHNGIPGSYSLDNLKEAYYDISKTASIYNVRDRIDLYVALVIGLMILSVAVFNYLILVRNLLDQKNRELSIRRINGCSNLRMLTGFMSNLFLLVFLAVMIGIVLLVWALPFFNGLAGTNIRVINLWDATSIFSVLGFPFLLLGITSLFIWRYINNTTRLKGIRGMVRSKPKTSMHAFNVFQLAVTVLLIVGSFVIIKQMRYISNKDIGLNKQVAEVRIPIAHKNKALIFKTELEKEPTVQQVSLAMASPVLEHFLLRLKYDDHGEEKEYTASAFLGDEHYLDVLGIDLIEGSGFSSRPNSNLNTCVINESLASLFPDRDLVGKPLPGNEELTVVGVVKDFHYDSLKNHVQPGYVFYGDSGNYLMVRPVSGQEKTVKKAIGAIWEELIPDYPMNVESIEERFSWMHRDNTNYIKLIGACSVISIFLSMMGLFAVSFLSGRRRTKEIGIRKVNGAKVFEVMTMLNNEFLKQMFTAFVIAMPIAWYIMHCWLENFAYKTELNWWVFVLAGGLTLFITLVTVSWQSFQAAIANPVDSLRDE